MRLSERQARFVEQFALHGNAAEAARAAGYASASARVTACRLLTKANVQAALQEKERQAEERLAMNRERVLEGLQEAVGMARVKAEPMAMIAAWREVARVCGYHAPERKTIEVSASLRRMRSQIEEMSEEELLAIATAEVITPEG
ncbi:MAG: terminase small subunit [Pseudomonadota bacterium]